MSIFNKTSHPAKWVLQKWFVRHSCWRYGFASCSATMCHLPAMCSSMPPAFPRRVLDSSSENLYESARVNGWARWCRNNILVGMKSVLFQRHRGRLVWHFLCPPSGTPTLLMARIPPKLYIHLVWTRRLHRYHTEFRRPSAERAAVWV